MLGKSKRNSPHSKKACSNRGMSWVKKHMSEDAKGHKIVVKGSCRKSHNKKSKKSSKKNSPLSKKSCSNRGMRWVKKHMSKDAKGHKIMVKGSCRKSHNKK